MQTNGEAVASVTYRVCLPNGELAWVETLVHPAPGENVVVCMTRDVSRQKKAALALEVLGFTGPEVKEGLASLREKRDPKF